MIKTAWLPFFFLLWCLFGSPVIAWQEGPVLTLYVAEGRAQRMPADFMGDLRLRDGLPISFSVTSDTPNLEVVYRLEPTNDDWSSPAPPQRLSFLSLPGGTYTFRIKGRSGEGEWGPETVFRFTVARSWLRYLWAILLIPVLIGVVSYFILLRWKKELIHERDRIQELKEVDRVKDQILANTSHELRTPLNSIIGLTESLLDGVSGELSSPVKDNLNLILASGRRLTNLVNDILDYAKIKQGSLTMNLRPLNLFHAADMAVALSKNQTRGKNLRLFNKVPQDLPAVRADADRLQQILLNLIGNAVKFTPEGHVCIYAYEEPGQGIVVSVEDTGIGVPDEKKEAIFNTFVQGRGQITREYGGTGLGLSIARQLVELHGGTLKLEDSIPSCTVFSFNLPTSNEPAPPIEEEPGVSRVSLDAHAGNLAPKKPRVAEPEGKGPHILVVDDEGTNRLIVRNHLVTRGYRVSEAADGPSALARLNQEGIDLVLLDVMMPGMSGYQVCEKLRENHELEDLPVIFLTARSQVTDLVAAFESGANDFLTKPVSREELITRVRTHLQLRDINRHLEQRVKDRTSELHRANQALEMRNQELETLDSIVKTVNAEIQLESVFSALLEQGTMLFPVEPRGCALIWSEERQDFRVPVVLGLKPNLEEVGFRNPEELHTMLDEGIRMSRGIFLMDEYFIPDYKRGMLVLSLNEVGVYLCWDFSPDSSALTATIGNKLSRFRNHALSAVQKAWDRHELKRKTDQLLDSLIAAGRIQAAILPPGPKLNAMLGPHFILYKPKEIVSGDFYWCHQTKKHLFIAVADCTGHGVQGALAAMVGNTLLNDLV
nr:response regulator [Acidobacteriota bacterium]